MVETCNIASAAKFTAESPRLPDRRQAEPARRTAIHSSVLASGLTANSPGGAIIRRVNERPVSAIELGAANVAYVGGSGIRRADLGNAVMHRSPTQHAGLSR